MRFTPPGDEHLPRAGRRQPRSRVDVDGTRSRRRTTRRPDRADRPRAGGGHRGGRRGAAALRHRRRRDAHVHRPGRRRALRVGVLRHGHRPAGLRLLRPERPEGADRPDGGRRPRPGPCSATAGRPRPSGDGRWTFATTPPIPVALFVVCAGPWHSVTWEHDGLPCGWHARPVAGRGARPRRRRAAAHHRRRASTTTRSSSTSPTRSTPTTRCSCRASTGAPRRTRAASPTATRCCRASRITDAPARASAPPSSPTRWRTCGSATW